MTRFWIGVVSKEHVLRGVEGGFCQVCHGKKVPLNRMKKGDYLLYYSPKYQLNGQEDVYKRQIHRSFFQSLFRFQFSL